MRTGDYLIQAWRMETTKKWISSHGRILDIGCHQGEFLKFLGARIGPSVGIDPLLNHDSILPDHHTYMQLAFEKTLPFRDQSFDAITLLATIEHIPNKMDLAREAYRLLKYGGRVVITVPSPRVDDILKVLLKLHMIDGMSLEEHHGFQPDELPLIFDKEDFTLVSWNKFQLGLNNLLIFEKAG